MSLAALFAWLHHGRRRPPAGSGDPLRCPPSNTHH